MQKQDLKIFLKKKVILNMSSGNGSILTYTGSIGSLKDDYLLFTDKFNKLVMVRYDVITSVTEVIA
jgi:hypothetical protein